MEKELIIALEKLETLKRDNKIKDFEMSIYTNKSGEIKHSFSLKKDDKFEVFFKVEKLLNFQGF